MAYISQLKYEDASGETKKVIDEWVKEHGSLTNMKETLIHSLPAFHALMEWFPLEAEIESFLGERAVNFFCYAISTTNDCLLCSVFFKKILDDVRTLCVYRRGEGACRLWQGDREGCQQYTA